MATNKKTCLYDLHLAQGAKMVPFAGYDMPVQYPMGVMQEHLHTRAKAGLFDVSHMGQILLHGDQAARQLEALVPVDVQGITEGHQRYAMFTTPSGGILDDLMISNWGSHLLLVVNAARKAHDLQHLQQHIPDGVEPISDRALLALQGPWAAQTLESLLPGIDRLRFMQCTVAQWQDATLWVSRSGYTGEDGFEISIPAQQAPAFAQSLLAQDGVALIGLGARDSLRTEAGLCLYGHDITTETSPIEAGLTWAISPARRKGGSKQGGFPGADHILEQWEAGPTRRRVGLRPEGRGAMREGTRLFADETADAPIGIVTSGLFGPSLAAPVSMAYLDQAYTSKDTVVYGEMRKKRIPATVSKLPFVPNRYKK